jgi:hypothetical protein
MFVDELYIMLAGLYFLLFLALFCKRQIGTKDAFEMVHPQLRVATVIANVARSVCA